MFEQDTAAPGARTAAVIVAHPDDEVLAFGGTICRHTAAGDYVDVLFLSTGLAARFASGHAPAADVEQLQHQARAAGAVLQVRQIEFAGFPDNRMDTVALLDVVKTIDDFLNRSRADIVYTHHAGDLNIDHAVTARAVLTACRPVPDARVRRIYAGEILSSSEYALPQDRFRPTTYIDIGDFLERKREALLHYTTEVRNWPHPRSIKAIAMLARARGSEVGLAAAEALTLLREIVR